MEVKTNDLPLKYCMKCGEQLNWTKGEETVCNTITNAPLFQLMRHIIQTSKKTKRRIQNDN